MKTHLKTLSTIAVVVAFITCLRYFPGITLGAVIFTFIYAILYAEIRKTELEKENEKQQDGKG